MAKINFEVGDEVFVKGKTSGIVFENEIGIIRCTKEGNLGGKTCLCYGVEFRDYSNDYHNLGTACKNGYGFWVKEDMLSLVEIPDNVLGHFTTLELLEEIKRREEEREV